MIWVESVKPESVKVTEMYHIEDYSTVFQLVSTVEGELEEGLHALDCIKAAFPGGSITGAPKIRAMEVIDEIEPTQRNVYTGSIGYVGFSDADLNVSSGRSSKREILPIFRSAAVSSGIRMRKWNTKRRLWRRRHSSKQRRRNYRKENDNASIFE